MSYRIIYSRNSVPVACGGEGSNKVFMFIGVPELFCSRVSFEEVFPENLFL